MCNVIVGLTISYLSLQVGCHCYLHTSVYVLENHGSNQNYMTTGHLLEMSGGMAVGTPGHDLRCACLVYFLYRYEHSAIVKYFMEHMSATWCDDKGWTLLHYACR